MGGFLVPLQGLADFEAKLRDPDYELVQVESEWEIEGKLTVWQFQKKGKKNETT